MTLLSEWAKHTGRADTPMQQIVTFATVAYAGDEIPMQDLIGNTGVEQSAVSRNVAVLGQGRMPGSAGYGLVEAYEDPYHRRRKMVRLTAQGKRLMAQLEGAFAAFDAKRTSAL